MRIVLISNITKIPLTVNCVHKKYVYGHVTQALLWVSVAEDVNFLSTFSLKCQILNNLLKGLLVNADRSETARMSST
jgi:hypothetical protein